MYGGKSGSKYIWYQAAIGAKSHNGSWPYASYGKSPVKYAKTHSVVVYRAAK